MSTMLIFFCRSSTQPDIDELIGSIRENVLPDSPPTFTHQQVSRRWLEVKWQADQQPIQITWYDAQNAVFTDTVAEMRAQSLPRIDDAARRAAVEQHLTASQQIVMVDGSTPALNDEAWKMLDRLQRRLMQQLDAVVYRPHDDEFIFPAPGMRASGSAAYVGKRAGDESGSGDLDSNETSDHSDPDYAASQDVSSLGSIDPTLDLSQLGAQAIELAAQWLGQAKEQQTSSETQQAAKIAGMMHDPDGKTLTMLLVDQAFRSHDPVRIAAQIRHLLRRHGVPGYFAWWERAALALGAQVSRFLPHLVVPFIVARLRQETTSVILSAQPRRFRRYLTRKAGQGMRLNINYLGEAVLGEAEADRRLQSYLELLARPDIEYISVKLSSVDSQIDLVAYGHTLDRLSDRLRQLYRQAMRHHYQHADGTRTPKFINLDMEAYADLHLTVDAFTRVLDEAGFAGLRAGIVLQAYLPDSSAVQRRLTEWAIRRVEAGGAPVKLRIVKGANLEMERVAAEQHSWAQAPYLSKHEVDANYKRMVWYGCQPAHARAVNLGVASHNLFDVSLAYLLRQHYAVEPYVEFEMLEGMANHQARTVQAAAGGMLLYAPVVKPQDFHSAIAYLVRRLDENTAEQNFLHDLFALEPGNAAWQKQQRAFLAAIDDVTEVADEARRQQNRADEHIRFEAMQPFDNVADTDFALPANHTWVERIVADWRDRTLEDVPLQIGGRIIGIDEEDVTGAEGHDPAQPDEMLYRYALAGPQQVGQALQAAVDAQAAWAGRPATERRDLLLCCAAMLAARRDRLTGVMMRDAGKRVAEADAEISEAIDFASYYGRSFVAALDAAADTAFEPLGTVLVTPPWNFPLAIPAGGVLAALAAGNCVLLKPAPETVAVAWHLVSALWDGGIPREVLQFVPTTDDKVGQLLVTDERVDAVILTGGWETAQMFLRWKPTLRLFAETSGKNALIVTAMADRDQAILDIVQSAFGHSGQKCSAASLAILEREVYEDSNFLRQLQDAVQSRAVGMPMQLESFVTPVIAPPQDKLLRALTQLDRGEHWLVQPRRISNTLWTPGVRLGVQPGSFFHMTECFGPVLGVMCADSLEHAIELANAVDFGLTGGLHSLDDREIGVYRQRIDAGNVYINRGTTGAIVQRQPFGGWKKSAIGTAKAGGPHYVATLGHWRDHADRLDEGGDSDGSDLLDRAHASYAKAWHTVYSRAHDPSHLHSESNQLRYRPIKRMLLRLPDAVTADMTAGRALDIERMALASHIAGVPLRISTTRPLRNAALAQVLSSFGNVRVVIESEAQFVEALHDPAFHYWQRLRLLDALPDPLLQAAHQADVVVVDAPVVFNGWLEMHHWVMEQSIAQKTHRYGNIIANYVPAIS